MTFSTTHKILLGIGVACAAVYAIFSKKKYDVSATDIPFAKATGVAWPVASDDPNVLAVAHRDRSGKIVEHVTEGVSAQRYFRSPRDGGSRFHAGIDLVARRGDPIRAMEDGIVLGSIPGYLGLDAVVVEHPSVVAVYAEIAPHSLALAGLKKGDAVFAGTPIGYGTTSSSGTMLHLELWERGHAPPSFTVWKPGYPPVGLLDPTIYLLALRDRAK
jgi:murein DD-endopeptidase MepM/ murein hydrolase activator NlpD